MPGPEGSAWVVPGLGVCAWSGGSACSGGSLPGLGGHIPACTEADTPPPVDRQTPVKILPWPNFVAAGKNSLSVAI